MEQRAHEIVIVGGGAGGLELATRLGDKLEYLAQGRWHHFCLRLGRMDGLNRLLKNAPGSVDFSTAG